MTFAFDPFAVLARVQSEDCSPATVATPATHSQKPRFSAESEAIAAVAGPSTPATVAATPSRTVSTVASVAGGAQAQDVSDFLAVERTVAGIATVAGVRGQISLCHGDFAERAAVLEHDGVVPKSEAEQQAAREAGSPDAAAYRRQLLSDWRSGLEKLLAHGLRQADAGHIKAALSFIENGWVNQALDAGWSEQELVYTDQGAPWARYERMGAAYFATGQVAAVTSRKITFRTNDGAELILLRHRGDGIGDVPWRTLDE